MERQQKKLFIDILNWSDKFLNKDGCQWSIQKSQIKVQEFIDAAHKSGFYLEVFIDAIQETEETIQKYKDRREAELIEEKRSVPHGLDILYGEFFDKAKIKVHYPTVDNDDTLASYASHYQADILSKDKDFFRYIDKKYRIYNDFEIKDQKLHLTERFHNNFEGQMRKIISPPPKTYDKFPSLVRIYQKNQYKRGVVTELCKQKGNPHQRVKMLRQALYYRLNLLNEIDEIYPIWNQLENKVEWFEERVKPDAKFNNYLDDPQQAIEFFFKEELKNQEFNCLKEFNYFYAIHAVVFELSHMATGKSFYEMIIQAIENYKLQKEILIFEQQVEEDKLKTSYQFQCQNCGKTQIQLKDQLEFLKQNNLSLPSRCQQCIQNKHLARGDRGPNKKKQLVEITDMTLTVFVGGLSNKTDENSIRNFFQSCGKVLSVCVKKDDDGNSKRFGFIDFSCKEDVQRAVLLDQSILDGKNIGVDVQAKNMERKYNKNNLDRRPQEKEQLVEITDKTLTVFVRGLSLKTDENSQRNFQKQSDQQNQSNQLKQTINCQEQKFIKPLNEPRSKFTNSKKVVNTLQ